MKKILSKFNILKETLTKKEILKLLNYHFFKLIAFGIITFFSFIIYLSLPSFFDYKNFDKTLQTKIYNDFKINIKDIKEISYSFIPSPHFTIKESKLHFFKENNKKEFVKAKNLKIYISTFNLFNKEKVIINKISLRDNNFYLNHQDLKNFFHHLEYFNNKPIYIDSSNFFSIDNNGQVISISPIKQFKYLIDEKKNKKLLNINGKLFDNDFKYSWEKDYSNPNFLKSYIQLKNPNIKIINQYKKNKNKIKGNSKINFLNNKIDFDFEIFEKKIIFKTLKNNLDLPDKVELNGIIDLSPFFFNTNISFSNIDLNLFLDQLFLYLFNLNNSINPNFNGNLNIKFGNLNSKLFEDIFFNLKFSEEKIKINPSSIGLKKIGRIFFSNIKYIENNGDLFLESIMKLEINDQKQFFRKFQIPKKGRINLSKISFILKKSIGDDFYFISDINFNTEIDKSLNSQSIYEIEEKKFKNLHQLSKIIREEFN